MRFLLSRRWALFALTVVLVAWATWWLGQWQFHRLHDRKADNRIVETNEHRAASPIGDAVGVGEAPGAAGEGAGAPDEGRLVTVSGTYDSADTITWRYRSDDNGTPGIDVVVPLVTD